MMTRSLPDRSIQRSSFVHRDARLSPAPETAETIAAGDILDTTTGPIAVEDLRAGDIVLDGNGLGRPVLWVGPLKQRVREGAGAFSGLSTALSYSRFDRVRFVRGAHLDGDYQVIFASEKLQFSRQLDQTDDSRSLPEDAMGKPWQFTRPVQPPQGLSEPDQIQFESRRLDMDEEETAKAS